MLVHLDMTVIKIRNESERTQVSNVLLEENDCTNHPFPQIIGDNIFPIDVTSLRRMSLTLKCPWRGQKSFYHVQTFSRLIFKFYTFVM